MSQGDACCSKIVAREKKIKGEKYEPTNYIWQEQEKQVTYFKRYKQK